MPALQKTKIPNLNIVPHLMISWDGFTFWSFTLRDVLPPGKKKKAPQYYLYRDCLFLLVRKHRRENSIHMDSWVIIEFPGYLFFNTRFHFLILKVARPSSHSTSAFSSSIHVAICRFCGCCSLYIFWSLRMWLRLQTFVVYGFSVFPHWNGILSPSLLFCTSSWFFFFFFNLSSTQVWL